MKIDVFDKKIKKYSNSHKTNNIFKKILLVVIVFIMTIISGFALVNDELLLLGSANIGKFSITYVLNGGTNPNGCIIEYDATTDGVLSIPTRSGYTFEGWYLSDSFYGSPLITTPTRTSCTRYNFICKVECG